MKTKKYNSIIYVNYSPYENSGKILDYLLENANYVFLFSIGFYHLRNKRIYNNLFVYKNGNRLKVHNLFQIPTSSRFIFILLPLRSVITFLEIVTYTFMIKKKYGVTPIYFTVNAYTAWVGNILKKIGLIKTTIFWVWDYYPPTHENIVIQVMRNIYGYFDKIALRSDKVIFINKRIEFLNRKRKLIPATSKYSIIPIGTDRISPSKRKVIPSKVTFGFIGVLKKSQGLGIIFESVKEVSKNFPEATYEIIGSGPDDELFKKMAKNLPIKVRFHGYLEGDSFNEVLKKCDIGIATYIFSKSNVSAYGDPGKVKRYLTLGIPVIATNVFEFAKTIQRRKAGVIIRYNTVEFVAATKKIVSNYKEYEKNAHALGKEFYYKKLYSNLLDLN